MHPKTPEYTIYTQYVQMWSVAPSPTSQGAGENSVQLLVNQDSQPSYYACRVSCYWIERQPTKATSALWRTKEDNQKVLSNRGDTQSKVRASDKGCFWPRGKRQAGFITNKFLRVSDTPHIGTLHPSRCAPTYNFIPSCMQFDPETC